MVFYNVFVFLYVFMFVATSLSHVVKSFKERNQTGIIEGAALFVVFSIILFCAYNKLVS